MPNLRASLSVLVASLSLCVASVSHAADPIPVPDGIANCQWLKVTARGTGYEVMDANAGLGPKRSLSADCYMQLVYMAGGPHGHYGAPILCMTDAVNWDMSSFDGSYSADGLGDGNALATDDLLEFTNSGGDMMAGYTTSRLTISVDPKTGLFKKATLVSLGGELTDSLFSQTFMPVVGGLSVKGSSITADKVPPQAKQLLAGGPCPQ
jgi:hypothetical protein